jgi:hypothetical protein
MTLLLNLLLLSSLTPLSTSSPLNRLAVLLHLETPPQSQDALLNTTAAPVNEVKHAQGMPGGRRRLRDRSTCANPCGYYGQLCCPVGAACLTDALGQAQCGAAAPEPTTSTTMATLHKLDQIVGGAWQLYTSTWVATDLVTRTEVYSSWVQAAAVTQAAAVAQAADACDFAAQHTMCGTACCGSGYYCFDMSKGRCAVAANAAASPGGGSGVVMATVPALVTTVSGVVVTQTLSPSATRAFITPVPTGYGNGTIGGVHQGGGLSPGAIAGIVIGVLLAAMLLGLFCCCWLAKDCIEAVMSFFGCGSRRPRRRTSRETIISEEIIDVERRRRRGERSWAGSGSADDSYRSRRSYDAYARPGGRRPPSPRRSGGGGLGGFGTTLAGLGTGGLMGMFGGRRAAERRTEKTSYRSGSYSNSGMLPPPCTMEPLLTVF